MMSVSFWHGEKNHLVKARITPFPTFFKSRLHRKNVEASRAMRVGGLSPNPDPCVAVVSLPNNQFVYGIAFPEFTEIVFWHGPFRTRSAAIDWYRRKY